MQKHLIEFTTKGFYCEAGNFYIDPHSVVDKALITHAHSDHAIRGHKSYLAHQYSVPILKHRLGKNINVQGINYNEIININGVKVSFHPAGHIIGSSQIRIEGLGEIWVISGDYKDSDDGISGKFEPVRCDYFVTESTFALPIFDWKPQDEIFQEINNWWKTNQANGLTSLIYCYALGKAQRILTGVDNSIGPIIVHDSIKSTNFAISQAGILLPETQDYPTISQEDMRKALVLAPSFAARTAWITKFHPFAKGEASGWMQIRGVSKHSPFDRGFALSDHSDWKGLNSVIKATGAKKIYATHGYRSDLVQWLQSQGYEAEAILEPWELKRLPQKKVILDDRLTLF